MTKIRINPPTMSFIDLISVSKLSLPVLRPAHLILHSYLNQRSSSIPSAVPTIATTTICIVSKYFALISVISYVFVMTMPKKAIFKSKAQMTRTISAMV
jgi:hypothetical protein